MSHSAEASKFVSNEAKTTWHDKALWHVREKRDNAMAPLPEWEDLRNLASDIKGHTLSNLDHYLEEFERQATKNGIQVHWASHASEHNQIVLKILQKHQAKKIVKSKSMLTEECGLNPFLEQHKIEVIDSDLGERIVQLAKESPSHIVLPAIHKTKEEVDALFQKHLGTAPCKGDPIYLTKAARKHLRQKFMQADAAITGVNFAISETGDIVICTNEGNADMGMHLAPVHIACMGIEKILPRFEDLGVFTRLLARSGTGQPITTYTTHIRKPKEGREIHVILVDNGRTEQMARPDFRSSLKCIRCGACMNTCPVYRKSGGHSYQAAIPGPIGAILSPGKDLSKHASLPFASTLCGSCTDVCPVKIDIHTQLYKWRQIIMKEQNTLGAKSLSMKLAGWMLSNVQYYQIGGRVGRWLLNNLPQRMIYNSLNAWGKARDLPMAPKESFRDWYNKNRHEQS